MNMGLYSFILLILDVKFTNATLTTASSILWLDQLDPDHIVPKLVNRSKMN
jgi:hypothetical protein